MPFKKKGNGDIMEGWTHSSYTVGMYGFITVITMKSPRIIKVWQFKNKIKIIFKWLTWHYIILTSTFLKLKTISSPRIGPVGISNVYIAEGKHYLLQPGARPLQDSPLCYWILNQSGQPAVTLRIWILLGIIPKFPSSFSVA
jgi:hypothetical protein